MDADFNRAGVVVVRDWRAILLLFERNRAAFWRRPEGHRPAFPAPRSQLALGNQGDRAVDRDPFPIPSSAFPAPQFFPRLVDAPTGGSYTPGVFDATRCKT